MPSFYNPKTDNFEMWGEKPEGYLTIEEWKASQPSAPEPTPPTQEEILATFTTSIQTYLDDFARTRLYDSIASAASYATSKNPVFQAEGVYAVDARDEVWGKAYEIQAEVLSGSRAIPTAEELMELLPKLEWPTERPAGMAGM